MRWRRAVSTSRKCADSEQVDRRGANDQEADGTLTKKDFLINNKILITTLGDQGSHIEQDNQKYTIGIAKPKAIVDPTGAGDAYIAGFLRGYLDEQSLQNAGQIGATLASFATEIDSCE